jgi:hypothetical protein
LEVLSASVDPLSFTIRVKPCQYVVHENAVVDPA